MCAARGKIILTLAFHTILYLRPKFHEIIFQIDQTTVIWSSPPIFPPNFPCHIDQNHSTGGFAQFWAVPKMNASGKIRKKLFNPPKFLIHFSLMSSPYVKMPLQNNYQYRPHRMTQYRDELSNMQHMSTLSTPPGGGVSVDV